MEGKKKTVLFLQDKTKALELSKQGLCSKKICEILNCGKTQINNLLNGNTRFKKIWKAMLIPKGKEGVM